MIGFYMITQHFVDFCTGTGVTGVTGVGVHSAGVFIGSHVIIDVWGCIHIYVIPL